MEEEQMLPYLDPARIHELLPYPDAVAALRQAQADGPPAVAAPPRTAVAAAGGHMLLMPAGDEHMFGVKIAGVAPANPAHQLPRITGTYLLHDATTLLPVLAIDGPALTLLRTAALSALAVDVLAAPAATKLLVYGTGPQAAAHVEAMQAIRDFRTISVAGRTAESTCAFARNHDLGQAGPDSLPAADVVVCCTSSATPLFDGTRLATHSTVVAMGSHTLDARELDTDTLRGAQVVVEDSATAAREAADVADAINTGDLDCTIPLHAVLSGQTPVDHDRRRVFRSVGMAWEDLVIAKALHAATS
ncbi:ornithine cyclodeaminase family protein [Pseudonocardia sp.]|uniref:ornithine cyclodeaminase family protein n=1 Tax=Pseudonocardia sp. TaxID=60912 RepID=UPI0026285247|nr:ornithine cyclodeaminase family protein [Pseudonocardia sp.]